MQNRAARWSWKKQQVGESIIGKEKRERSDDAAACITQTNC